MGQKTYLIILKSGIYLSFLSIFFVFSNFLFPYISSKQIYFNILIEVLAIFWLAFIIKYPDYLKSVFQRPAMITWGLIFFFSSLLISSILGVDFNLSFWGDVERMLGLFHLLHFFLFYLIIITLMRSLQDWEYLLFGSVIASVFLCLHGIGQAAGFITNPQGQGRIIATIGNAAYVGAYAIFNFYFALLLLFKRNELWIKMISGGAAILNLIALILSGTRGAYLGLGVSILILLAAYAIFNKKTRKWSLSALAVFLIIAAFLFANANKDFIAGNSYLYRFTHISLTDATMQTRLISWKTAAQDFVSHPFFGSGYGNFAITFDKYFDPTFYDYTRSETYFDRAHNNLVDIASTSGAVSLLFYLFIFLGAAIYLIRGVRNKSITLPDFLVISALIIAYFIQNLVVFDSLATYIPLMLMLGYITFIAGNPATEGEAKDEALINKEIYALAGFGLILVVIIYQFNIKPAKMLAGTIEGQKSFAQGDLLGAYENYKKALSYNTVLDRDSRDSFVKSVYNDPTALASLDKNKAQEVVDFAISLEKKNVSYNSKDSLMQTNYSLILDTAARLNNGNRQKLFYYADQALNAIDTAIASSPKRIPLYFTKAQIHLTRGQIDEAIADLNYAISLNDKYYESTCQLGRVYFIIDKTEEAFKTMDKCIDAGGASTLGSLSFTQNLIEHYVQAKDWTRAEALYQQLSTLQPNNADVWINLAKVSAQLGHNENAINAAKKAAQINPAFSSSADEFIKNLQIK